MVTNCVVLVKSGGAASLGLSCASGDAGEEDCAKEIPTNSKKVASRRRQRRALETMGKTPEVFSQ
jgi:hypothetical protein